MTNKLDQASAEVLRYAYDANGRLTNRWSAAKGNTVYSYDDVGNLTLVNYPTSPDITLAYDALNRVTNIVDAVGTTKYTYHANGQLLTEDGPWANDTVTLGYNTARLRNSLSLQQPSGSWTNGFTYDAARRLASVTSPAGTYTYTYKSPGTLVTNLALPNTSAITNAFDSVARLTETKLRKSDGTILNAHSYLYNQGHQRTRQTRTDASYVTYTHDNIGQLQSAIGTGGQSTENLGYAYDTAWNLNTRTNAGFTEAFAVNVKNELTSAAGLGCWYDGNGNLTARVYDASGPKTYTYVYDDENQLVSVIVTNSATDSTKSEFVYDGLFRRRVRKEFRWQGGTFAPTEEVRYGYDGRLPIQERNAYNVPLVTYTRGKDLSGSLEGAGGIGGLLARTDQTQTTPAHAYYHTDGNGNVTALVSPQQRLAARYIYDPYGNTLAMSGPLAEANTYRFSSQEFHRPSGLALYLYRPYDPNLQRWPVRDRIGELGGLNLYRYLGNRPVNRLDPYGLLDFHWWNPMSWFWPGYGGPTYSPPLPLPYDPGQEPLDYVDNMTGDDIPSSASGRARSWRDGADDAEEFRDSLGKELATQVACSPGGGWLGGKLLRAAKGKLDDLLCKTKGLFKKKTPNLSLGKLPKDSPLTEEEWAKIDAVFHGPKGSLSNRAQVYNILVQALMDRGYTAEEIIELLNQGLK